MQKFYTLAPEQQARHFHDLARQAIKHWGIENASISLIKHRENAVFSVIDHASEQRYALRVHRFGYHSDASLRSELQWMQALTEAGVATPPIIPTLAGDLFINVMSDSIPQPHQCDLLGWVEGDPLGSIDSEHAASPDRIVDNYRVVGNLAGRLHNQSQEWQLPEGFTRASWDVDGLIGNDPLWGRFWELEPLTNAQRELLHRARDKAEQQLRTFGQGADLYGLIHNDFLPENLLLTADGIRIIDFDDAGFGWHLFEFATSLFFHLDEPYFDAALAAMIEGYREVRELPEEQLAMLPTFFLVRGLVYLGWVHTRKDTDTAKAVTPELIEGVIALVTDYLDQ
ncbi:MAG: phosphotransferase [Amphritea sp.]